ncbi:hypothetical protein IJ732_06645 [bacterium]|nr:hypothetical protein [bacterium]
MKKTFVILMIIIKFCLPVFADADAEYVPIPKELSKQYKAEIEQIIDEEYPKIIKNIDEDVEYGKQLYEKILKNGYDAYMAADLGFVDDLYIPTADLKLYAKLVQLTQEKYLKIDYDPPGADWVTPFEKYMKPYFRDNNVNTEKLKKIVKYEIKQSKIIRRYLKKVQRLSS